MDALKLAGLLAITLGLALGVVTAYVVVAEKKAWKAGLDCLHLKADLMAKQDACQGRPVDVACVAKALPGATPEGGGKSG